MSVAQIAEGGGMIATIIAATGVLLLGGWKALTYMIQAKLSKYDKSYEELIEHKGKIDNLEKADIKYEESIRNIADRMDLNIRQVSSNLEKLNNTVAALVPVIKDNSKDMDKLSSDFKYLSHRESEESEKIYNRINELCSDVQYIKGVLDVALAPKKTRKSL